MEAAAAEEASLRSFPSPIPLPDGLAGALLCPPGLTPPRGNNRAPTGERGTIGQSWSKVKRGQTRLFEGKPEGRERGKKAGTTDRQTVPNPEEGGFNMYSRANSLIKSWGLAPWVGGEEGWH